MKFKQFLPSNLKLVYRIVQRRYIDMRSGQHHDFARTIVPVIEYPNTITIQQKVMRTSTFNNKINNIMIASDRINGLVVKSGEIFSFWQVLGNPSPKKGYKKGRNIISGRLSEDYGGGLCQLSGIIYYLSLKAGLQIVERYSHTVDIYQENERFAPLGSDATVVFGYKDLRIRNTTAGTINFQIKMDGDLLVCHLNSELPLEEKDIYFQRNKKSDGEQVLTRIRIGDNDPVIANSWYKSPL